jgi:predicted DNA-binding transcriptional regulator YafY
VFDKDLGGYRLEAGTDRHELPGVWFTADELLALLTIQNMLVELMPSLLGPKLRPLQRKMNEMLGKQGLDPDVLAERIRLVHAGKRQFSMAHFETLAKATLERKRLRIVHFNRERGQRTEREISPQQLVHYRDNWYVDARCHLRREIRCFGVDAIEQAEILDADAVEVDKDQLRLALGESYGIFAGSPRNWACLKFSPQRSRWVRNEQWHPDQRQVMAADGSLQLEVPYSDERELLGDVLRFGPDVEVLGPPELQDRFVQMLGAMHDQALKRRPLES